MVGLGSFSDVVIWDEKIFDCIMVWLVLYFISLSGWFVVSIIKCLLVSLDLVMVGNKFVIVVFEVIIIVIGCWLVFVKLSVINFKLCLL